MRKPGPFAYVCGNPLTLLAALGATVFFGYQWWSANASPVLAIMAFLLFCQSMRATDQLTKYNAWKREWEAMEGKPRTAATGLTPQSALVRYGVGTAAWCIGAYAISNAGDDPQMQFAKVSFWLGTVLGLGAIIYRNLPRKRRAASLASTKYPDVSVCLAVPRESPSAAEARAYIPPYCKTLIQ